MSINLFWFRSDLRTRDNLALNAALAEGPVVALYIATPEQWRRHDDAPIKLDFWRRNLLELENKLKEIGVPLVLCQVADYAGIPELFEEIIHKWEVSSVYFNAEYPLHESRRDDDISLFCRAHDVKVKVSHDQCLLQPGSILNNSGLPFKVFTPYSRKCRSMLYVSEKVESVGVSGALTKPLTKLDKQCRLDQIDWPEANSNWETLWPAGEKHAQHLLAIFCKSAVADYKKQRDFPALDGTSTLSPWLNAGVLSIRDCWRNASVWHQGEGVETWKNELLWREFYRHIIFHFPHVSQNQPFKDSQEHVPWRYDKEEFTRWCEGKTGIPIIDAAMRQLLETGWMHNRLRMITAMFLSKHLLIDWRWGERFFMQHLVDGDFSANNGGWQWSASTGTDSVPYFRVFNPVTQSKRFDGEGEFIRRYVPELIDLDKKSIHQPGLFKPDEYPLPIIDLKFGRERVLNAFRR
jgi:deoxyribodipyrimidine photo-lyase